MNTVSKLKSKDSQAIQDRKDGNKEARTTGNIFEGVERAGDKSVRMDGVDLRNGPAYREKLDPNERKEKDMLIKVLTKYCASFEQLQDKKVVPMKLRRQALGSLRMFFSEELDESYETLQLFYAEPKSKAMEALIAEGFENIHGFLNGLLNLDLDYDLLARLEDEYMDRSL